MTRVTLFRSGNTLVGFEAKGHTDFAFEGEDIVCSAISALTQAAANGLTEVLGLSIALDMSEANLYCMTDSKASPEDIRGTDIILRTMALGLKSIAEDYGDYIKIVEREV